MTEEIEASTTNDLSSVPLQKLIFLVQILYSVYVNFTIRQTTLTLWLGLFELIEYPVKPEPTEWVHLKRD